jgi:hypothetical protein
MFLIKIKDIKNHNKYSNIYIDISYIKFKFLSLRKIEKIEKTFKIYRKLKCQ